MSLQRRVAKLEASTGIGGPHGEALRPLLRLAGWPEERPIPDDCTLDALFAAVAASPASSPMARLRAAQSMASAS